MSFYIKVVSVIVLSVTCMLRRPRINLSAPQKSRLIRFPFLSSVGENSYVFPRLSILEPLCSLLFQLFEWLCTFISRCIWIFQLHLFPMPFSSSNIYSLSQLQHQSLSADLKIKISCLWPPTPALYAFHCQFLSKTPSPNHLAHGPPNISKRIINAMPRSLHPCPAHTLPPPSFCPFPSSSSPQDLLSFNKLHFFFL